MLKTLNSKRKERWQFLFAKDIFVSDHGLKFVGARKYKGCVPQGAYLLPDDLPTALVFFLCLNKQNTGWYCSEFHDLDELKSIKGNAVVWHKGDMWAKGSIEIEIPHLKIREVVAVPDLDTPYYVGDGENGVYITVAQNEKGYYVSCTIDTPHYIESPVIDDGPHETELKAVQAGKDFGAEWCVYNDVFNEPESETVKPD